MLVITVTFDIGAPDVAAFTDLVRANAATSTSIEPGCRQFDVCTSPRTPGEIFLYEVYDDAEAFDRHLASAHFKAFDAAVAPMVRAKTVRRFEQVWQ